MSTTTQGINFGATSLVDDDATQSLRWSVANVSAPNRLHLLETLLHAFSCEVGTRRFIA